jgi:hypothetical protein
MTKIMMVTALSLALAAACNKNPSVPTDAQKTADVLTGDAKGSADANPLCKLFTVDEIASYEGAPVSAGANAAMGTGCQWVHRQGDGNTMIQVVTARYYEESGEAVKSLPGVGEKAFVTPDMGGWKAGAIQRDKAIIVSTGGTSSEAKVIALLKEAMKRVGA